MGKLIFESIESMSQSFSLMSMIPDTHAWVKDAKGKFVYANELLCQRFGIHSTQEIAGKTDFCLSPEKFAISYRDDDRRVLNGESISERLELMCGKDSRAEWFSTSKWPIENFSGRYIGSLGISRALESSERKETSHRALNAVMEYIKKNFDSPISIESLAKNNNMSVSALERRFRKYLQKTPGQYINQVRLNSALQQLLNTEKRIGTIALESGFSDHSHFTRAFSRYYGKSPRHVRSSV
ncbi:helix-turn-helix domain-containing protein [Congregibacter brevis]|uniref:Helix-turn-helix domain-containing protein n=1 Tax=Congregibacter brevis TaxID=3081201 RepID=A0ABZ0IFC0_9GAMM|nr:helix-turn-helix domain-containing protein [Congregibacter sp. IMCC45268]